jgi:hypothetical protein
VGGLLILLALGGLAIGLVFAVALLLVGTLGGAEDMQALMNLAESQPTWLTALIAVGLYFSFFIFWGVLTQTFLTLPLIRHFAETLQITGAPYLAGIRQRGRDEFTEAEGFAEALDVGAAI